MTKEELTAKVVAAPAQAVPAPGVEAVSEREFKQFLSDVLTAAGLVTHGKKCKDLGRRLGEMSMRLLTAPKTAAAPGQAQEDVPDMFWDADDTEIFAHEIQDIIDGYGPGEIVTIECAKWLPNFRVVVTRDGDGISYEYLEAAFAAQKGNHD